MGLSVISILQLHSAQLRSFHLQKKLSRNGPPSIVGHHNRMKHLLLFLSLLVSTAQAHENVAADDMAVAANNLIDSLDPEQKAIALFSFDREQRYDWHFIPKERKGLPLTAMNARQRDLAGTLLASGLSSQGLAKAKGIMNLEEALQVLEKGSGSFR